jgi:hypothetical protein
VPIIKKQELSKRAGAARGADSFILVGVDQGSQSLHIEEVRVAPNARIPRCISPHTEVAIIARARGITAAAAGLFFGIGSALGLKNGGAITGHHAPAVR